MLLIFDEAQTAFGRLGHWFAATHLQVTPDIMTVSKTLGAACRWPPLSRMTRSKMFASARIRVLYVACVRPTAVGGRLGCARNDQSEHLLQRSRDMGDYLAGGLRELQSRHEEIGDVRGMGLLRGIELVRDRETREPHHELGALTTQRCLELGLSMNIRRRPERGSVWRIAPPLTVTKADIDLAMTIFDQALVEAKDALAARSIAGKR